MLQVVAWGPSYYFLFALLLALAVMGAVSLVRRRGGTAPITTSRVTAKALGMTALFFVATLPAITFPAYLTMPTTGRYPVATADYTYTDQSRIETYTTTGATRSVNVRIWYPAGPTGRYPLVVFSPGAISEKLSNTGHLGLTDLAIVSPLLTRLLNGQASTADPRHTLEVIDDIGLQFFDSHLKGLSR